MESRTLRAAIVGASTLLGRELAEQLADSGSLVWTLSLFDEEAAMGRMTAAGDQALIIQALEPGAFAAIDVVFFASDETAARTHWKQARQAGAVVLDLSGGLEHEPEVPVACPWIASAPAPDLSTVAVAPAHPAAVLLALVWSRLRERIGDAKLIATVLQPASQHGSDALEELRRQTAALLSFQAMPREVYDSQVAFNLQASLGPEAKVLLAEDAARIRRHFALLTADASLQLQVIQAPVFNGYTASIFVETQTGTSVAAIRAALHGDPVRVTTQSEDAPSNQNVTEQGDVLVSVQEADGGGPSRGFWLWAAADNVRLAAENGVACAAELVKLRPGGKVQ